jgi:FkbM family methyltransferase
MNRTLASIRHRLLPQYLRARLNLRARADLVRIGSGYGGWIVPGSLLTQDSVCYCAGVGEDITFDLGLIERFGCQVWGLDPTPRSAAYVQKEAAGEARYHFLPVGLWSETSVQRFYAPSNPSHVSHSIVNLQGTEAYFEASCMRLSEVMSREGHAKLDLLKLDIEGAEYAVLDSLHEDGVYPSIVAVEFDQPTPLSSVMTACREMQRAGYDVVAVDGWNVTFVRKS